MDMTADPPIDVSPHADASINHTASLTYWNSVSSDVTGMLGGYPQTSRIDLLGSSNFLTKLRRGKTPATKQALPPLRRVADCGAGIGRITKGLLMGVAERVDVVEPVEKFTAELVAGLEKEGEEKKGKLGEVVNLGLQDWEPERGGYDLIWNQWCLGHLTDAQLVAYLERCKAGLRTNEDGGSATSWIVVKENMSTDIWKQDIYDDEDSSVTRSDEKFRELFKKAGLRIVATEVQKGFPKELFPVRMYALRPE
jgi:protein N-terminal methyltransferase